MLKYILLNVSAPSAQICQHVIVKDCKQHVCFQGVMEFMTVGRVPKITPAAYVTTTGTQVIDFFNRRITEIYPSEPQPSRAPNQ